LRERFFPLHEPADAERLLASVEWCALFKAGTGDRSVDAWLVTQRALEPRPDVAIGFIRLPEDRPASDHVAARLDVPHRSPQFILVQRGRLRFALDEVAITPDQLVPRLREHLPDTIDTAVRNEAAVSLDPYRRLLSALVRGEIQDERFQWSYLERLERDAEWRDEETVRRLAGLFDWHAREIRAARIVAHEFQARLAGRAEPLQARAARLLDDLRERGPHGASAGGTEEER
jgi:bacillithiol system protein YtxJ